MLGLGFVMFRRREKNQMAGHILEGLQRRMRAALERGVQQGRCSCTANTCANILNLWLALWTFTTNPAPDPTNNAAEQALLRLVLKRKTSRPTRSLRGDQFLSHGFTVHETCLRQGVDLWKFMHEAVTAFIANTTPLSLMPRPLAAAPIG
jgi:transposase